MMYLSNIFSQQINQPRRHMATFTLFNFSNLLDWCKWVMQYDFRTSSVIRQKGKFQNGCFKKTKHAKFSEKRTFLTPWYAHVRVCIRGVRKVRFSENLACFVFLKHCFEIRAFALLPCTYQFCHSVLFDSR